MKVQIWTPTRLLMCLAANLPKAAAPPATLTSATMMPNITKKVKIPALSDTAGISPSLTIWLMVPTGMNPEISKPPTTTPTNSDV